MIFTKLTVQNFGIFAGEVRFDLAPERSAGERRNVILFGGKNGSGKTTILEAVRLCLYGQRSRGYRVRRRDYEKYLKARIHRGMDLTNSPDSAAVTLDFDHVHAGNRTAYVVRRSWRSTGLGLDEQLKVWRDGELLTEFDQEHWEDFIKELVPPGVSQLFFFDGEKIQSLAEEDGTDSELSSSIKSLLGLDLGERLAADLSVYTRRVERPSGADTNWLKGLERLEAQVKDTEEELKRLRQERAQAVTRAGVVEKNVQKIEDRISREGGSFARQRERLLAERTRAEADLEESSGAIRALTSDLLPFVLAPELARSLRGRLSQERQQTAAAAAEAVLADRLPKLKRSLKKVLKEEGIASATSKALLKVLEENLIGAASTGSLGIDRLHPVAVEGSIRLVSLIDRAFKEVPSAADGLATKYEKAVRALTRAEAGLQAAPDEDVIRPLLEELGARHSELAEIAEIGRRKDAEIQRLEVELNGLGRAIEKKEAQIARSDNASNELRTIGKVQNALRAFSIRVKERKLEELRSHFRDCFATLARKEDLVRDVEIDPNTFAVTFLDQAGRTVAKAELSAGEKQIYAIAVLWALARVSGRPLPFLIDTPLGRLDSDHRGNLVDSYFPRAAHQVIILSTDTEIDRPYFRQLRPYVARSYHLHYEPRTGSTQVLGGYFWTGEDVESAEVESPAA